MCREIRRCRKHVARADLKPHSVALPQRQVEHPIQIGHRDPAGWSIQLPEQLQPPLDGR
jgi:hypothetical protein